MPQYRPKDSPKTIYYRIFSCGQRPRWTDPDGIQSNSLESPQHNVEVFLVSVACINPDCIRVEPAGKGSESHPIVSALREMGKAAIG